VGAAVMEYMKNKTVKGCVCLSGFWGFCVEFELSFRFTWLALHSLSHTSSPVVSFKRFFEISNLLNFYVLLTYRLSALGHIRVVLSLFR
jgi:hypothetical protein